MPNEIILTGGKTVRVLQLPRVTTTAIAGNAQLVMYDVAPEEDEAFDFDPGANRATRLDYVLAAASGALTGALNVLWQKEFDLESAKSWGDEKVAGFVAKVAKAAGMTKKDATIEDAIRFLEKSFPMAADKLAAEFGGSLQHHLRDFSHHPSPVGLACSILMQFTGKGYGTDTDGRFVVFDLPAVAYDLECPLMAGNFAEKIAFGTVFWALHLVSDMAGSSSTPGKGVGIPGAFLSFLKELSSLPLFQGLKVPYSRSKDGFITIQQWISKLFNGTAIKTKGGKNIRFDLRAEIGLLDQALSQLKAVIANEVIVRCLYMLTRLKTELERCEVSSVSDLRRVKPANFLPYNSRALTRMVTVASSIFVLTNLSIAAVRAGVESKGNGGEFARKFFLRVNFAGVGRLAFALHADWGYMAEEIAEAWDERAKRRQDVFDGFHFYALDADATRVAYSLKLAAVRHDYFNDHDEKRMKLKRRWTRAWRTSVAEGLGVDSGDYFLNEGQACEALEVMSHAKAGRVRALLIAQELLDFVPYQRLGVAGDKDFKGLKAGTSWAKDKFPQKQDAVDRDALKALEDRRCGYERDLSGTIPKMVLGGLAVAAVTAGTAGLAVAFAPGIAVSLVGGSFVGLSGAALANASLAALGGGALSAGGFGMAGGTAIITGGGAALGLLGSSGIAVAASMGEDYGRFVLQECSRLLAFLAVAVDRCPHEAPTLVKSAGDAVRRSVNGIHEDIARERAKGDRKDNKLLKQLDGGLGYMESCLKQIEKMQERVPLDDGGTRLETGV